MQQFLEDMYQVPADVFSEQLKEEEEVEEDDDDLYGCVWRPSSQPIPSELRQQNPVITSKPTQFQPPAPPIKPVLKNVTGTNIISIIGREFLFELEMRPQPVQQQRNNQTPVFKPNDYLKREGARKLQIVTNSSLLVFRDNRKPRISKLQVVTIEVLNYFLVFRDN